MISPTGQTLARTPATPVDNSNQPVPFDSPLGMAFQGDRLLIANSAFLTGSSASWAVLSLAVGERGVPQQHPSLGQGSEPALRLSVRPRTVRVGRRTRLVFTVTAPAQGASGAGKTRGRPLAGVLIRFAGRTLRTGRHGTATIVIRARKSGRLRARASDAGYLGASTFVRVSRPHHRR
jgi:hypothetical protein